MHRILPPRVLFLAFAWVVLGLLLLLEAAPQVIRLHLHKSAMPAAARLLVSGVLWNPIWRWFWRRIPKLNEVIFPDLNGEWDVELRSNWTRQLQLLEAASSPRMSVDMRHCAQADLAPLSSLKLKAKIKQTWWSFHMKMWNPSGDTPIKRSDTISVDPIRRDGERPAGICYFYKQENVTDNIADDVEFYGAARLTYDFDDDRLEGLAWTARMWRRAMNTAGTITMTRCK